MRLLVCLMVCEKDGAIASRTSRQLVDFLGDHELHVLLFDDGSASHVGWALELQPRIGGCVSVVRAQEPRGYSRLAENFMQLLSHAASSGQSYDYVLRTDPDVHFGYLGRDHSQTGISGPSDRLRLPRRPNLGFPSLPSCARVRMGG
jgi:hypothetical protein